MAFTPNEYLYNDSNVLLRDQQHAARLFADDQFRLAPKHKFLFHVSFSINPAALQNINLVQRHRNEINMLVKSCDLPSFAVTVETLNQYNRKKNVQTTHKYNPINISFHDDNMGVINQLWQNYYSYYYADSLVATDPSAYQRNATRSSDFIKFPFGLDNGSTTPFFNHITVYQMARHEYVSYKLHNPVITSWNHNKVDYEQSKGHDNNMQIAIEAVSYGSGIVQPGDPEGFGFEHYDNSPSPLKGEIPASSASFTGISPGSASNIINIINTVTEQVNTYQNTQSNQNTESSPIVAGLTQTSAPSVSGLQGFEFPVQTSTNNAVTAEQSNVGR
jgi:hypothetical protein